MDNIRKIIRKVIAEIEAGKSDFVDFQQNKPQSNVDNETIDDASRRVDQKKIDEMINHLIPISESFRLMHSSLLDANYAINLFITALEKGEDGTKEMDTLIKEVEYIKQKSIFTLDNLDYIKRKI